MKFALCFLLALCGNALSGHLSFGPSVLRVVQPNHFLTPTFFNSPPTQEFTIQLKNDDSKTQGGSDSKVIRIPTTGSGPITIRFQLSDEDPSDDSGDDSNDINSSAPAEDNDDQNGAIEINDDSQNEEAEEPEETPTLPPRLENARSAFGRSNNKNRGVPSRLTASNNRGRSSGNSGIEFDDVSIIRAIDLGGFQLESRDRNPASRRPASQNEDIDIDAPAPSLRSSGGNNGRGRSQTPTNARQRVSPNSNRSNPGNTNTPRPRNQAPTGNRRPTGKSANRQNSRPNTIKLQIFQPTSIIDDPAFQAPPLIRILSP